MWRAFKAWRNRRWLHVADQLDVRAEQLTRDGQFRQADRATKRARRLRKQAGR